MIDSSEQSPWRARILTLFPEMFPGPLSLSLSGKALEKGIWDCEAIQIRDFAEDKHKTVDDIPYGGGPGMVLKPDVLHRAILSATEGQKRADYPIYYLSPRGRVLDQAFVKELSQKKGITLLCGRYEGIDERVLEHHQIEELSIGDYVLSGGEMAAFVVLDSVVRLLPGVMGNVDTAGSESFEDGLLEYPHYTRPAEWMGREVPDVLKSGHHADIEKWRKEMSLMLTKDRREDLFLRYLEKNGKKTDFS